jgi:hypothetical protein
MCVLHEDGLTTKTYHDKKTSSSKGEYIKSIA